MSQISLKNTGYFTYLKQSFARPFVLCLAVICLFLASPAMAAVNSGIKTEKNPVRVLKTTLAELADRNQATLDWQTQEFELIFDLPADGWYESMDLFLTAIPEGNVGTTDPITISYNGEEPISLYGQASRFDAHIKLDPSRIRTARNSLKIRYKTPHHQDCLSPAHGKWILDLGRSKLATKTRSKPRDLQIVEFKQKLNHPMTAPNRVAIRAFGKDKSGLEALVAQGIASRMDTMPSFQFTTGNADLEILIGAQDKIETFVNDTKMLEAQLTRAFTDSGARPKLVLIGQSDADVLALARSFASHEFPDAHRREVSLNEFRASAKFNPHAIIGAGIHNLSQIGDTTIEPSWNPSAVELEFNVAHPDASEGTLTLNIVKSPTIDPQSRLRVRLNGQSIGYTMLDKTQKFVSFDIKPGMFRSATNTITIAPAFAEPTAGFTCASRGQTPSLMVSNSSKLVIKSTTAPTSADLSQFAASGAPLSASTSSPTTVVLTSRTAADRAASLQFIGYAAQQFGPQFAQAEYLNHMPPKNDRAKNILIVGPNAIGDADLLAAAPSALRLALRGKPTTGPNTLTVASIDRYASSSERVVIQRLAQQLSNNTRIKTGGIAALFASPYSDQHMIGIVTSNRPSQFAKSMKSLTQPGYWNGLQGSVARWNSDTIMMAQTASVLPASYAPEPTKVSFSESIAVKWSSTIDSIKSLIIRPKKNPAVKTSQTSRPSPLAAKANSMFQNGYAATQKNFISFRDNDRKMLATRMWLKNQAHNRTTLMALIIISIVLMIGMAVPKSNPDR